MVNAPNHLLIRGRRRAKRGRGVRTQTPPAEPIPELSDEIVLDILVRLPVKSLLQCKSVCKGWRAIITDPFFVRAHLKRSASRYEQDPCLLITPHTVGRHFISSHIRFYQWQQGASMATLLHEHDKDFGSEFRLIPCFAQCDGLVLVPTDTRLYLFNPATRETITLPDRDSNRHHSSIWDCCSCAGLGLDPRTGKHKVVRAFYRSIDPDTGMGTDMGMEVFTVSGNSNGGGSAWREIKDDLPYPAGNRNTGTAVNGFLFWRLASVHRDPQRPWGLLRLSLADETLVSPGWRILCVPLALDWMCCTGSSACRQVSVRTPSPCGSCPYKRMGARGRTGSSVTLSTSPVYRPLAFLPGGRMMLYSYTDYKVCLYDMATAKLTTVCQISMKYQGRRPLTWKNISYFNVHLYTESLLRIGL